MRVLLAVVLLPLRTATRSATSSTVKVIMLSQVVSGSAYKLHTESDREGVRHCRAISHNSRFFIVTVSAVASLLFVWLHCCSVLYVC
jgi:hypothetical protein